MSRFQFGKIKTTKVDGDVTSHTEINIVDGSPSAPCLLYTSDAADEARSGVVGGGGGW